MPLVGTMSYGNCTGSDISWARCYGSIRIPHDWAAGEVRTCQWVWKLTEQMYVDCFDYRVVAGDDSPKDSDQPKVKSISVPIEETDNNLPVISDTYAPGASGRQLNCAE
jgi:hypothetical protein